MPIVPITLTRRSNRSRHGQEGGARLVNCYAEDIGPEGKHQFALYAVDGMKNWGTVTGSGVRAMQVIEGEALYVVSGRTINHVDTAGNATAIGGIIGDGMVTMARNNAATAQVGICADGLFKIATGKTVVTVTDADLPPANSVCNLDGYFVLTIPNGKFYVTALNDGTDIDGLDFATAQASPDGLVRGYVRNRDLCLFGNSSTEFWQNVGGADFPFSRTTSIDVGCLSGASVATVDQTVAWVADDGTVRILNGYQAQPISTKEIERLIDEDPAKDEITGFSWKRRGHIFYALSGTNWTKVCDVTTGEWHDMKSYGLERWRMSAYAKFAGHHIFGDYESNSLYETDSSTFTEAGEPIVMSVEFAPIHGFPYRMVHHELFVDVVTGVGLNSTDEHNQNPMLMMDYSSDGGENFGAENHVEIGAQGETGKRLRFRRLGQAENGRVYRLKVSADVVKSIMAVGINAEQGAP
jgi:hypothetical protein